MTPKDAENLTPEQARELRKRLEKMMTVAAENNPNADAKWAAPLWSALWERERSA